MKKRLISFLLVFAMVLTMLSATALAAPANESTSADTANDSTYGSYGCYGGITIHPSAEFTAQGYTQALTAYDLSIELGNGITADASTAYDGSEPVTYEKACNDTYKWYHAGINHNH